MAAHQVAANAFQQILRLSLVELEPLNFWGNNTQPIPAAKHNAVHLTSPNQTREVGQQPGRWKL
jgi:hypothetical protein